MYRPVASSLCPSAVYFESSDQRTHTPSSEIPNTTETQTSSPLESPTKRRKTDDSDQLISEGYKSLRAKDFPQAIAFFQEADFFCPNDHRIHQGLAESFYYQKNFEEAIRHLNKGLELHPTGSAFELRAEIFRYQKQLDKALEDFTQALSVNPESSFSLIGRADIFLQNKQFDDAVSDLQKALQIDADNAYACILLSFARLQQGFSQESLDTLNRIIQNNPDHVFALYVRSNAFYKIQDYQGALNDINRALELDPGNPTIENTRLAILNHLPYYPISSLA